MMMKIDVLSGIDIKSVGSDTSYWNMYRGNLQRNGYLDTSLIGGYIAECPEQLLANMVTHLPRVYTLNPLYPNPFNPTTTISYTLSNSSEVIKELKYNNILFEAKKFASALHPPAQPPPPHPHQKLVIPNQSIQMVSSKGIHESL